MPKKWETRCAWGALALGGLLAAVAGALPCPPLKSIHAWFWCLALGFSGFFGFGVWSIWLGDPRTTQGAPARDRTWFIYQYVLNALGCFVGWVALYLLWRRFHGAEHIAPTDFALAAVVFIGLVGWLPRAVLGLTEGLADLARKILGA